MKTTTVLKENKVRLGDIIIDPTYQIRTRINPAKIAEYAAAMRNGHQFPPIIIEEKSGKLICGFTRYEAYQRLYEPNDEVAVEFMDFKDEKERLSFSLADNLHGEPLDSWDKKNAIERLVKAGASIDEIRKNIPWSEKKIAGYAVFFMDGGKFGRRKTSKIASIEERRERLGKDKGIEVAQAPYVVVNKENKLIKNGLAHLKGRKITEKVYTNICEHYVGWTDRFLAEQLIMRVDDGTLNSEDEENSNVLRTLIDKLEAIGI